MSVSFNPIVLQNQYSKTKAQTPAFGAVRFQKLAKDSEGNPNVGETLNNVQGLLGKAYLDLFRAIKPFISNEKAAVDEKINFGSFGRDGRFSTGFHDENISISIEQPPPEEPDGYMLEIRNRTNGRLSGGSLSRKLVHLGYPEAREVGRGILYAKGDNSLVEDLFESIKSADNLRRCYYGYAAGIGPKLP